MFQYKGRAVDIKKLGRELGVRYVLEGSIRRAPDTIRVSAQLLDASSGAHLWAETFDRPLTAANLFAVQDEITGSVVSQIADAYGVIARARFKDSQAKTTGSLDAYECLLRTYELYANPDPKQHLRVRDCLERVTSAEPGFADGWAWLSQMYLYEYLFGLNPRSESPLDRALQAAQRAVTVDPASQMAHFALAIAHYHRREHKQFAAQAEEALALNPNNAVALAELGYRFTQSGQLERGVALTRKAMRLNPQHPSYYYVAPMNGHFLRGEYEQALAEALKWTQDFYWAYVNRAAIYGKLGRRKEAQAEIASLLKLYPDFPKKARQEYRIWFLSDRDTEQFLDGLRKAGLEIPPEAH
jgi:tetratricopeptide (TPR) repeat protein